MADSNWPIVLIEGVLVLGGALAFGWWQLRSVRKDQERSAAQREAERRNAAAAAEDSPPSGAPPMPPPSSPG